MNPEEFIILVLLVTTLNSTKNNHKNYRPKTNINQLQYHDPSKNPAFLMLNHNNYRLNQFGAQSDPLSNAMNNYKLKQLGRAKSIPIDLQANHHKISYKPEIQHYQKIDFNKGFSHGQENNQKMINLPKVNYLGQGFADENYKVEHKVYNNLINNGINYNIQHHQLYQKPISNYPINMHNNINYHHEEKYFVNGKLVDQKIHSSGDNGSIHFIEYSPLLLKENTESKIKFDGKNLFTLLNKYGILKNFSFLGRSPVFVLISDICNYITKNYSLIEKEKKFLYYFYEILLNFEKMVLDQNSAENGQTLGFYSAVMKLDIFYANKMIYLTINLLNWLTRHINDNDIFLILKTKFMALDENLKKINVLKGKAYLLLKGTSYETKTNDINNKIIQKQEIPKFIMGGKYNNYINLEKKNPELMITGKGYKNNYDLNLQQKEQKDIHTNQKYIIDNYEAKYKIDQRKKPDFIYSGPYYKNNLITNNDLNLQKNQNVKYQIDNYEVKHNINERKKPDFIMGGKYKNYINLDHKKKEIPEFIMSDQYKRNKEYQLKKLPDYKFENLNHKNEKENIIEKTDDLKYKNNIINNQFDLKLNENIKKNDLQINNRKKKNFNLEINTNTKVNLERMIEKTNNLFSEFSNSNLNQILNKSKSYTDLYKLILKKTEVDFKNNFLDTVNFFYLFKTNQKFLEYLLKYKNNSTVEEFYNKLSHIQIYLNDIKNYNHLDFLNNLFIENYYGYDINSFYQKNVFDKNIQFENNENSKYQLDKNYIDLNNKKVETGKVNNLKNQFENNQNSKYQLDKNYIDLNNKKVETGKVNVNDLKNQFNQKIKKNLDNVKIKSGNVNDLKNQINEKLIKNFDNIKIKTEKINPDSIIKIDENLKNKNELSENLNLSQPKINTEDLRQNNNVFLQKQDNSPKRIEKKEVKKKKVKKIIRKIVIVEIVDCKMCLNDIFMKKLLSK